MIGWLFNIGGISETEMLSQRSVSFGRPCFNSSMMQGILVVGYLNDEPSTDHWIFSVDSDNEEPEQAFELQIPLQSVSPTLPSQRWTLALSYCQQYFLAEFLSDRDSFLAQMGGFKVIFLLQWLICSILLHSLTLSFNELNDTDFGAGQGRVVQFQNGAASRLPYFILASC